MKPGLETEAAKAALAPPVAGPSRKPFMAPRSHSAPSLTPWTGTPSKGMKRSWNPATAVEACVRVENKKMEGVLSPVKRGVGADLKGKGKGKGVGVVSEMDDVEKGLSELYVSHERSRASYKKERNRRSNDHQAAVTKARSVNQGRDQEIARPAKSGEMSAAPGQCAREGVGLITGEGNFNQGADTVEVARKDMQSAGDTKKSWRRSIVGGAYNAGVLGAALGLTAYRLMSNRGLSTLTPTSTPVDRAGSGDDPDLTIIEPSVDHTSSTSHSGTSRAGTERSTVGSQPHEAQVSAELEGAEIESRSQAGASSICGHDEVLAGLDCVALEVDAGVSSIVPVEGGTDSFSLRRAVEQDLPPPPAYEESVSRESTVKGEWEELDEHLVTPANSRMATLNLKHHSSSRRLYQLSLSSPSSSTRRKFKVKSRSPACGSRSMGLYRPLSSSSTRSRPTVEIEDQHQEPAHMATELFENGKGNKDALPISQEDRTIPHIHSRNRNEGDKESISDISDPYEGRVDGPNEMMARLDSMSARLEQLINEGKKALESTGLGLPRTGTGTTPGWEDENPLHLAGFAQKGDSSTANHPSSSCEVYSMTSSGSRTRDGVDIADRPNTSISSAGSGSGAGAERKSSRRQSRIPTKISPPSKYALAHADTLVYTPTHTHKEGYAGRHVKAGSSGEVEKRRSQLGFGSGLSSRSSSAAGQPIPTTSMSMGMSVAAGTSTGTVTAFEGGSRIPVRSKSMTMTT
ncbi:hypothetical protein I317_05774 [Kwoniella heveanensis CBS 569]|nr:hypothetical protein I317_05774 [Kwoniella heveanensis CBS 569]